MNEIFKDFLIIFHMLKVKRTKFLFFSLLYIHIEKRRQWTQINRKKNEEETEGKKDRAKEKKKKL